VLLARESPLTEAARKRLAGLDGSETVVLAYFVLSGAAVVAALVLVARRFGRE